MAFKQHPLWQLRSANGLQPRPETGERRVEMVFRDTGQRDKEGRPFLCYFFVPEKGAKR